MYSDHRDTWLVISEFISDLCLVLCCDIYRDTLISIMYSACMIKYMIVNRGRYSSVVSSAPLADIMGSRDATGRVAKWSIEIASHGIQYEPRTAIKSQALADFLVDWAETQYAPPAPGVDHWRMHFDGSKMKNGLGASVVLTSPKGDHLNYVLQIHFAASNNVAEYEALVHGIKLAKEIG